MCGRCGSATLHTLSVSEDSTVTMFDADGIETEESAEYHLFRCNGCLDISLYVWSALNEPGTEFGEKVYPFTYRHSTDLTIPNEVRDACKEAEKVKDRGSTAYAVMVRRVLEIIVRERGIDERNLFKAIVALSGRDSLPPTLIEAFAILRKLGNAAAHSADEKLNSIHADFIEWLLNRLLDHFYIAPARIRYYEMFLDLNKD